MSEVIVQKLINEFLKYKDQLSYVNVDENNRYLGWVSDFGFSYNNTKMFLDLKKDDDLFLLFVLALAWARTGPWENAAYLVTYMKKNNKSSPDFWKNRGDVDNELKNKDLNAKKIQSEVSGCEPRKDIYFRKDIFESIFVLANKWNEIKEKLTNCADSNDYIGFMEYVRSIEGLGSHNKSIFIKIPLIIRELRCQNIYKNIPGELCCVPDKRVKDAAQELNINIGSLTHDLSSLIKVSSNIYNLFGDLYDIPLFAYEDLKKIDGSFL